MRYIDADKIDYTLTMVGQDEYAGYRAVAFESDIDDMPTANVVPKSQVEKIFAEIETEITEAIKCNYKRRTEYYTKERFKKEDGEFINMVEGKLSALRGIEGFVEELKKKYTGEK